MSQPGRMVVSLGALWAGSIERIRAAGLARVTSPDGKHAPLRPGIVGVALIASASAQAPTWVQVPHVEARARHVMVHDSARQRMVVFGGQGFGASEVQEWDGVAWATRSSSSLQVPQRSAAVFDPVRARTVLFASQTHAWNGRYWSTLAVSNPPRRADHAMAFDTRRGRAVLFGGQLTLGGYPPTTTVRSDTWEFDGQSWIDRSPSSRPRPRSHHAMAYDAARGVTVLFGGNRDVSRALPLLLRDTWEWDGTTWTERAPANQPSATDRAAMAFDAARGVTVLMAPDGTWEWDGNDWALVAGPGAGPGGRADAAMAFDPRLGQVVLFGGVADGVTASDTWAWDGSAWSRLDIGVPAARNDGRLAYEPAGQRVLLLGGYTDDATTWAWDGQRWQPLAVAGPTARWQHALVHHEATGETLLFGGIDKQAVTSLDETWAFDGSQWRARNPPQSPSPRWEMAMAYDPVRQRTVLFGGQESRAVSAETWEWDGSQWRQQNPANQPAARRGAGMAYDRARGRMLLFGGDWGAPSSEFEDTWEWDGTDWTLRSPATSPPGRTKHRMYYDPLRQQVMLWGGSRGGAWIGGLWAFDGTDWVLVSNAGGAPVRGEALAYDGARDQVVTFGGEGGGQETWRLGELTAAGTAWFNYGCAGTAGTPRLAPFGVPVLGNARFAADLTGARPGAPGVLLVGVPAAQIALGGSRCVVWVDPLRSLLLGISTNAAGYVSTPLPITAQVPVGLTVRIQAAVVDPAAAGLGIATTEAVVARAGH